MPSISEKGAHKEESESGPRYNLRKRASTTNTIDNETPESAPPPPKDAQSASVIAPKKKRSQASKQKAGMSADSTQDVIDLTVEDESSPQPTRRRATKRQKLDLPTRGKRGARSTPEKDVHPLRSELVNAFQTLQPLMGKLQSARCPKCHYSILTDVSIKQHVEQWTSDSSIYRTNLGVIHCPQLECTTSICIACSDAFQKSHECDGSNLITLWFLLAYYDQHVDESIRKRLGSRPVKAKAPSKATGKSSMFSKSKKQKPAGVGYASEWGPPHLYPKSSTGSLTTLPPITHLLEGSKADQRDQALMNHLVEVLTKIDAATGTPQVREKGKSKKTNTWTSGESQLSTALTMIRLSHFPARLAELLRNDSIEDAVERGRLYKSALNLVSMIMRHANLAPILTEEYYLKGESNGLVKLADPQETPLSLNVGYGEEKATPTINSATNLVKACKSVTKCAQTTPSAYKDSAGKDLLNLCTHVVKVFVTDETSDKAEPQLTISNLESVEMIDMRSILANYQYGSLIGVTASSSSNPKRMRTLFREISILTTSLPRGVFVKVGLDRPDVMKVLIPGPEDTPYYGGLFEFDIFCPSAYPEKPPQVHCATAANHSARLNPNLYETGYVCLSLIGTWSGTPDEQWQASKSTLLQVVVSIQSMIFVKDPAENEPGGWGADNHQYNQKQESHTCAYGMLSWLQDAKCRDGIWKDIVQAHFREHASEILNTVKRWAPKNKMITEFSEAPRRSRYPLPPMMTPEQMQLATQAQMQANLDGHPPVPPLFPLASSSPQGPPGGLQQPALDGSQQPKQAPSTSKPKKTTPPPPPPTRDLHKELKEALQGFLSAFLIVFIAAFYHALTALAVTLRTNFSGVSSTLEDVLGESRNESLVTYPTDLTRDIVPVGHERSALTTSRTLDNLYIQPILRELNRMNPESPFVDEPTKNGLFDTLSTQTLYLWIDLKTPATTTFSAAVKALEPLRSPTNYLTSYTKDSGVQDGPVTVIFTGNTQLSQVQDVSPRDYFFDAPLDQLSSAAYDNITKELSPIASVKFEKAILAGSEGSKEGDKKQKRDFQHLMRTGKFNDEQEETIEKQIEHARGKGIGARYWDTPGWPVGARDRVWKKLWEMGVELVNADDLEAAAGFLGGRAWDAQSDR
ncbi:MAG: hypothetical protein M1831_002415 [Alyxoria varia]|nr:MAG: hypothetical protein M1831_002415 [Alyxoria varia]